MGSVYGRCMGRNKKYGDFKEVKDNTRFQYENVVAKMPVESTAFYYKMDHPSRGLAIIFNHEIFDDNINKTRQGTQVDNELLMKQLNILGFQVKSFQDLTCKELRDVVDEAAKTDHINSDCFFMAVLTHGKKDFLFAKDNPYKPEDLWLPFTADKCPTLAGKPKLFFIQACQGDNLDSGVILTSRTETDGRAAYSYKIPSQADFLFAYSTIPGYYSWRNTTRGSWFIQALCQELKEKAFTHDLLTLLTFVIRKVAFDCESNIHIPYDLRMHSKKQTPCVTTRLTRFVKFTEPVSLGSA